MKIKTNIIITLIIILLLIAVGYIVIDKGTEYLQKQKADSYELGLNNGINYWNEQVTNRVNNEGKLPFIINNTVQTISIEQLCGSAS